MFQKQFCSNFAEMFTRVLSYLLLLTMVIHASSQFAIVADYLINSEFITNVFCVNKEKPEMKCNGKCHLAKQLKKDEEKKSSGMAKSTEIQLILQQTSPQVVTEKTILLSTFTKDHFGYQELISTHEMTGVFHPPTFVV